MRIQKDADARNVVYELRYIAERIERRYKDK